MIQAKDPHAITLETFPKTTTQVVNGTGLGNQSQSELQSNPREIAQAWLNKFSSALASSDLSAFTTVLHESVWWRDHLAISWDLRTLNGLPTVTKFLSKHEPSISGLALVNKGQFVPQYAKPAEDQGVDLEWIESMFTFSTGVGHGKGMLRLTPDSTGEYKAYMLYTALQDLKDFPEPVGSLRPHGGDNSLATSPSDQKSKAGANWLEGRVVRQEYKTAQPDVLVIGAGQSGLNTAARLQALGISCLLIDKKKRVGDNWRDRYRTLVTHDPVQYTHMYGLPFPQSWPLFTPKDKLGDWFEAYASLMELDVWTSTTIENAEFDDTTKQWTVAVLKNGLDHRTLTPKHVIFATGQAGEPRIPSFPGQDEFKGIVYHGSQHKDAFSLGIDLKGKKVLVVGTGNSGHDVAQNYYEAGATVTMLQRSGTYVIQADKGLFMLHEGLYEEGGPPIEDADVYGQSLPIRVQFKLNIGLTQKIKEVEKENVEGLEKVGFEIDYAEDGSGIYRKYVTQGGGYYIDVGASRLLREGKIGLVRCPQGIEGFEEDAVVLRDGRRIQADVVVLATGFDNMRTTLRKALGDKVAERAKDVWDLDEEGELNAMWRPSGHPRLWYMGGSLALCRIYARFLALQIKAIEAGLNEA